MSDIKQIEAFLYHEASLLDRPDLEAWMALYTEDGSYWMPAMVDQPDPQNYVSHIYDDRVLMEIRKRNFVHPRASSKDFPVHSSHLIGNVREIGRTDAGDLKIASNFHAVMYYREEQRVFAGTYEHHLVANGSTFQIRHKRVDLINADAAHKSIIVYL